MGHGLRFSPDRRYVFTITKFCDLEADGKWYYPVCKGQCVSNLRRFYCMLWEIFNLNLRHCDKEVRAQTRLTDFAGEAP
jgi:hypothetical protein